MWSFVFSNFIDGYKVDRSDFFNLVGCIYFNCLFLKVKGFRNWLCLDLLEFEYWYGVCIYDKFFVLIVMNLFLWN